MSSSESESAVKEEKLDGETPVELMDIQVPDNWSATPKSLEKDNREKHKEKDKDKTSISKIPFGLNRKHSESNFDEFSERQVCF